MEGTFFPQICFHMYSPYSKKSVVLKFWFLQRNRNCFKEVVTHLEGDNLTKKLNNFFFSKIQSCGFMFSP